MFEKKKPKNKLCAFAVKNSHRPLRSSRKERRGYKLSLKGKR